MSGSTKTEQASRVYSMALEEAQKARRAIVRKRDDMHRIVGYETLTRHTPISGDEMIGLREADLAFQVALSVIEAAAENISELLGEVKRGKGLHFGGQRKAKE